MKMKVQNIKILAAVLGISILGFAQSFAADKKPAAKAAPTPACTQEKADFKKLYIELQKSLNYEGKDAYLDGKNNLQLKPHTGDVYEGKVFEEALFKEYQNSLRKVALMYQAAKFDDKAPADFKTNQSLVEFIKAIDSEDGSKYISSNNINTVIDGLQKASVTKYPADSKFRINDNDKYLLKKLLTHAQDRLCSIEKYQETGKRDRNFTAEELEKKKNAPLNQLILAIKDAKLTKDSDIKFEDIVDEKVAVNSAIAANINALHEWAKKNKSCVPVIKTPGFMNSIQAGIQQCNYRKFVDALSDDNVTNIESILHFINSNEKFLKGIQTKAETSMDEFKLQAYVDRTFANLGNKINCTEVANSTKSGKRLFVRNLPYLDDKNKFDTSKITCKVKTPATKKTAASEKILTEQECTAKIDLISDELGRGLEVRQKNQKEAPISFSIKDNPDCNDIALVVPQEEAPKPEPVKPEVPLKPAKPLDAAACKIQGEAQKPIPIFMTISFEKDKCQTAAEFCSAEGKRENPPITKIQNPEVKDKVDCIAEKKEPEATVTLKTKEECAKEGKDLSEDKKSCVETEATCKAKKAEGKVYKWEENKCVESDAVNPQEKECLEKIKTDPSFEWKDNKCVNRKEACEAQSKEEKTFIWTDKNTCEEKKESDEEKICRENNAKRSEEKGGVNSDWKIKDGKCIDTKEKKSPFKAKDEEVAPEVKSRPEQPFTAPARFVPIQIPTRQMYILPGMM